MKVLNIISSSGFYGAESVVLGLMRELSKSGVDARLICLKSSDKADPDIHDRAAHNGVKSAVFPCRGKLDLKTISRIREYIVLEKIDVVHTHNFKSDVYGFIAAKLSSVPIIATAHGWTGEDNKVRFYELIDRMTIKYMDFIVAVSPAILAELCRRGINEKKTSFIPNAVDTGLFDPSLGDDSMREKMGLKNSLVVGTVGRLSPEKGQIDLLEAFREVSSHGAEIKLLIVGDGKLKDQLKDRAKDMGLEDKVIFAGKQTDMPSVYKCMDIFVLPSLTEGMPVALLEAMSMGLPNIATKVGAVPYVLDNDEGRLVPPGDVKELSKSMLDMVKDASLRSCLGKRARAKVAERFSLNYSSEEYLGIYKRVSEANCAAA